MSFTDQSDIVAGQLANANIGQASGGQGGAIGVQQAQPPVEVAPNLFYVPQRPDSFNNFNNAGLISDPTLLAQQQILNRAPTQYQPLVTPDTYQDFYKNALQANTDTYSGLAVPNYNDPNSKYLPPPPPPSSSPARVGLVGRVGGGGGGGGGYSSNINDPGNTGMFTDQFGRTVSNNKSIGIQDYENFGVVQDSSGGFLSDGSHGSIADTGMGVNSQGQTVSNDATIAAQDAATFGSDSAGGGSSKIVCTAMNQTYGFGSFRNAIWLRYASKHLTKAHEAGYHAIFLPLVDFGFKQGDGKANMAVRRFLEWGARHRSADLRAEMRGTKRDPAGRVFRLIFEPLCYAVGKLKGY